MSLIEFFSVVGTSLSSGFGPFGANDMSTFTTG